MKAPVRVSFVIPNWNHKQLLDECIISIKALTGNFEKEIIVIDNASEDGSAEFVKDAHPSVICHCNDTNTGYAKATNLGVSLSTGQVIFLLNNDIRLFPECLQGLFDCLSNNPRAGAAAPLLYYPDGRFQISCRRFPSLAALILEQFGVFSIGRFRKWKLTQEEHICFTEVPQPMASALLIRRECWEEVGPLDEGFPIFFNDVDWCYRLYKDTNYTIALCHNSRAIHHEGVSVNRLGLRKKINFYKGLIGFYRKHWANLLERKDTI
ncbi:glycosyltransferase family 2 protein [Candidatus Magnetominusculus xianensis]|uniref:Glycosyl transferase family 2 n=1 Tax=Candidatus Magnetominusculus xianensis TaxID=1748249 RepID=A0ABR5SHP1_9BACT|nr:glycosyltransferase family 2 protein [Candidatus Magnetominusculus xianensis]KWT88552.1 glycosyl transferase family 2 [Candidatus Magnetominusculus xianensis]MBF0404096.1 glycosyltransferase family 2 protein [Nitrospirota bacterium]